MSNGLQRYRGVLVGVGLLALGLAIYLPYALKGGWYYDDWALYSTSQDAGSSWSGQFDACTATISGGRKLTCLYHATLYHFLTDHRTAYHLVAIAFLVAMVILTYSILRRCRLGWIWSALIAALLVVFPASDATRLWPTGSIGQYVIVLELIGVLLTLSALGRGSGWRRTALHAGAALLFVVAMLTYEIAVPLVALNGIIYWFAYRSRAALVRGAVDLGLAFAFVLYRLIIDPANPSDGFTVHRTIQGDIDRAWALVSAAWRTWRDVLLPGGIGVIGVIAVLAIAAALAYRDPDARRRLRPWAALVAAGLVVAVAATLVFITASDIYIPQVGTLFNRVTLPAAIPYVCVFVGLLGLGYEIVRHFVRPRWVAALAVSVVVGASCWHQLHISSDHKRLFEASWSEQRLALSGFEQAVAGMPVHNELIGFGAPMWEPGFIPVFGSDWDLRGAIDYETAVDPGIASMLMTSMRCGPRGIVFEDGTEFASYRYPGYPLYFVDAEHREHLRVRTQRQCERAIARWGRTPELASLPAKGPS